MRNPFRLALSTTLPLLLAACGGTSDDSLNGYAEGDYVRVASPIAGTLVTLAVRRGDNVAPGANLFVLEQENERAARAEAEARLQAAISQLEDLRKGRRPPEVDAVRNQLAQAEAALRLSSVDLKRQQELAAAKFVSPARVDEARAAYQRDTAHVQELQAQLRVAELAARPDAIAAAEHEVAAAREVQAQAAWRLGQKGQTATQAGVVTDTMYWPGEWVSAGSPVVTLLPPGNIKARFFVAESRLGSVHRGQRVELTCDGCGAPLAATVSFIAPQAEFTPPVIYSKENRAKLVFLVEARPAPNDATRLHPGQPLTVRFVADAGR